MTEPFLFVVGCNRSGTTLLRAMLDSHPDLAVPPEAYFVVPALRHASRVADRTTLDGTTLDRTALLREVAANPWFGKWQLPAAALDDVRDDDGLTSAADVLTALYARYAAARGKTRFGDKTPRHVLHMGLLARSFPQARFVHLVRDGRDVVPSMLEHPSGPDHFPAAVQFWRERVEAGRAAGVRLGPTRYREIRYEDFVADPAPVLRSLCTFAELADAPEMLRYQDRAGDVVSGVRDARHHQGLYRPPTRDVRDWRTSLDPDRVRLFEALAGALLDELGYEQSGLRATRRTRAHAAAWRLRAGASARVRSLRRRASGGASAAG